jgi:hypothetical protein
LNVAVYYSGGTVPFAGATVYLDSYNGQFGTWATRASGTTDGNGNISFSAWPTTLSPTEKYRLRILNGATQVGSDEPVYVNNTPGGSTDTITTSNPLPTGTVGLTVNSSSGATLAVSEMNAVILFTSAGSEVARTQPPTSNPVDFTGIAYGSYYADVYCWDMLAARTSTFLHNASPTAISTTTYPKRPLYVTALYSDGVARLVGATVYLDSYNGQFGTWNNRANSTTDGSGNVSFSAWPTTLSPAETYRLRIFTGSIQVWEKSDVIVANSVSGSSYAAMTSAAMNPSAEFFDDFSYSGTSDTNLALMQWIFREGQGKPGITNATWTTNNIQFIDDLDTANNLLMRVVADTQGTPASCNRAEVEQKQTRFFEGTYAARLKFTDQPATWSDITVQAFFTINTAQPYAELDFEYLAYDQGVWWGPGLYETSWGTYIDGQPNCNQPREITPNGCVNPNAWRPTNLGGWHVLMIAVSNGRVQYYLDDSKVADHGGTNYPDTPMAIAFSHWFDVSLGSSVQFREHEMLVDWVYYGRNAALSTSDVQYLVSRFRADGVVRRDTIGDSIVPTVTVNQAAEQSDPTSSSPINFTVIFSEPVTGFTSAGVTVGGTAGANSNVLTGSGTTYNVAVSGMSQSGAVTASIPAGVALNAAGTSNLASTSTDNIVTYLMPIHLPCNVNAGLVAYYPFNGNANDESGNNNNGAVLGTVTLAADRFGIPNTAYRFNGGVSDVILVSDSPSLRFATNAPITVALWAFRTGTGQTMHIVGKRDDTYFEYQMALNNLSGEGLAFGSSAGCCGGGTEVATGRDLELNTWKHLVGTFDGGMYRFYIDGLLVSMTNGVMGKPGAAPLKIGGSSGGTTFVGLIDDVRIYNRALSPSEIQFLSMSRPPLLTSPRMIANGGFAFTLIGDAGCNYRIEAASDLTSSTMWTPLATLPNVTGTIQYTNVNALNLGRRFYRAVLVP